MELHFDGATFDSAIDKKQVLGMLVGLCSVTRFWDGMNIDYPNGSGVFQDATATDLVNAADLRLKDLEEPNLGLASTRQLLDELRARIETDHASGGGGLDYTTVHGRPALAVLDPIAGD